MKLIGKAHSEQEWNSRIVAHLSFIKKHLRYPMTTQTAWPAAISIGSMLAICCVFYVVLHVNADNHRKAYPFIGVMLIMVMLPASVSIIRYWLTLRFVAVAAQPTLAENMVLLQRFLQANNFAYARHAEAPEVFQMLSKNLGRKDEELREVVVFIADDNRILVNSHFTRNESGSPVGSPHYRKMARALRIWLKSHSQQSPGTALRPF